MLCSFIILVRRYRQCYKSMRCGDRIMQEVIVCKWMPIFYALKKRNYVQICLNTVDKEYGDIPHYMLQEIRGVNAAF